MNPALYGFEGRSRTEKALVQPAMQNDPNSPSWRYGAERGVSVPLTDFDKSFRHHRDLWERNSEQSEPASAAGLDMDADRPSAACPRSRRSQSRSGLCAYETDEESVDNGMAVERRTVGRDEDEAALANFVDLPKKKQPR